MECKWNCLKIDQFDDILAKKNIKVAAISETKNEFGGSIGTNNYLRFYHGVAKKLEGSSRSNANDSQIVPKHYQQLHPLERKNNRNKD
jgi:hypothetical protein